MRVGLAGEEFGGTFADAVGAFAAVEAMVVEIELEQSQVVGAKVSAEGEVVPQTTIEIFDEGTGAYGAVGHIADGFADVVEAVVELLAEFGLAVPAAWIGVAQVLQTQEFAERALGDLKACGEFGKIGVELGGEAEQLVAMVVEEGAERIEAVRTKRGAVAQLCDDEVEQVAAVGAGRTGQGEDILAEPIGQDANVVGQGDGLFFLGLSEPQLRRQALVGASVALLVGGGSALEFVGVRDGFVGLIFQSGHDGENILQSVEDIAPARRVGKGQVAARAQSGAEVGDEGLGVEAALVQFEEADAPGDAVAMIFLAEQEAVGGRGIDADEDRLLGLEDFIDQADVDGAQDVLVIDGAGADHGFANDVVDGAEGNMAAQAIVEVMDDAAVATAAIEQQGKDVLPKPFLGDGKVKEDVVVVRRRCESLIEGLLGDVDLLMDELTTDVGLLGQSGDGEGAAERPQGQVAPLRRRHGLGGTGVGDTNVGGLGVDGERNSLNHVCFLHETAGLC